MGQLKTACRWLARGLVVVVLLVLMPPTRIIPSMAVMGLNNIYHQKALLTSQENINIKMPAGSISSTQTWYPFMLKYNASDGFSKKTGENITLSILYNFGDFELLKGRSQIYTSESAYEGAFYGAYLVRHNERPFTFLYKEDGRLDHSALEAVAEYDYTTLVLGGLGARGSQRSFKTTGSRLKALEVDGVKWTQITSVVETRSPAHVYDGFKISYFQYGLPDKQQTDSFNPMTMYSRVWVKRLEDKGVSLVLYAMSPDEAFLEEMTQEILYKTYVELKD